MDIYILRIELIRYEIALRHTAFNIREEIHACFCRCRQREWRKQAEPPPAYFFFFSELLNALEQISERERYVFMARVLDGISFEELGAELGLGYKGVAAVYYRAVSKIRKRMKEVDQNEF